MARYPRGKGFAASVDAAVAAGGTNFSADVSKFAKLGVERANRLLRHCIMVAARGVVSRSPVDIGTFRAQWRFAEDAPDLATDNPPTMGQEEILAAIFEKAKDVNVGSVAYVTNNMPYGPRLEYGWSRQAPSGMVRVTLAELDYAVEQYLRRSEFKR